MLFFRNAKKGDTFWYGENVMEIVEIIGSTDTEHFQIGAKFKIPSGKKQEQPKYT